MVFQCKTISSTHSLPIFAWWYHRTICGRSNRSSGRLDEEGSDTDDSASDGSSNLGGTTGGRWGRGGSGTASTASGASTGRDGGGRSWDAGGERRLGASLGTLELNGTSSGTGSGGGGRVARVENLVNDVNYTILDEDVRGGDQSTVDEEVVTLLVDGEGAAVESGDLSAVSEVGGEDDGAVDNVVGENRGDGLAGSVGEDRGDVLESSVAGSEDGDVVGLVHGLEELGLDESTSKRRETSSSSGDSDVGGEGEDLVNNVDDTSSEVDISLDNSRVALETGEEGNAIVHGLCLEVLGAGNIFVVVVVKERAGEERAWGTSNVSSADGAVQNVVVEDSGNEVGVGLDSGAVLSSEASDGLVVRSKDGDPLCARETVEETWNTLDKLRQLAGSVGLGEDVGERLSTGNAGGGQKSSKGLHVGVDSTGENGIGMKRCRYGLKSMLLLVWMKR